MRFLENRWPGVPSRHCTLDLHGLIDIDMDVDFGTQEENSITSMTFLF